MKSNKLNLKSRCSFWRKILHSDQVLLTSLLCSYVALTNIRICCYGWVTMKTFGQQEESLKRSPLWGLLRRLSFRKKCSYSELSWSSFSCIRTRITPNPDSFHAVCGYTIATWSRDFDELQYLQLWLPYGNQISTTNTVFREEAVEPRVRSLVVSGLRSETKGCRFEICR